MRTFINNKYNFIYSKFNYQNAFCNICNYKNDSNNCRICFGLGLACDGNLR